MRAFFKKMLLHIFSFFSFLPHLVSWVFFVLFFTIFFFSFLVFVLFFVLVLVFDFCLFFLFCLPFSCANERQMLYISTRRLSVYRRRGTYGRKGGDRWPGLCIFCCCSRLLLPQNLVASFFRFCVRLFLCGLRHPFLVLQL